MAKIFKQTKKDAQGNVIWESPNWTIKISSGKDPITGKRGQRWYTFKGNMHEAKRYARELETAKDQGMLSKPSKTTLAEYLNGWLKDYAWPNLAPRTAEGYEQIISKNLIPNLGHLPLTGLKPEHLQQYYGARLAGGLGARTVNHHHATLHSALQTAVKRGILVRNPADAVDSPHAVRTEMRTLSEDDLQRFLDAAKQTDYYPLFYLALFTGMRRSELLALRWCDIDLLLCQAQVTRSIHRLKTGETVFRQPKTAKSRRLVALSPSTVQVLREYRAKRENEALHAGKLLRDDDLIFYWQPDSVSRGWMRLARRTGLGGIRLHDARHTHASLMLKQGVHPKVVQERLGHSSITITLDTYSHVAPGIQEAAAKGFDDFVKPRDNGITTTR